MVMTEGDMVRLDLSGCRVDVTEMKRISERVGSDLASAADEVVDAGVNLFEASRATVLPEWDGIARQIARGRGGADDLIRDVREATLVQRLKLGRVRAEVYQRRGESARAAAIRSELNVMISADEQS
jgi:hypothetical protein